MVFQKLLSALARSAMSTTAAGSAFATGTYVLYKDQNRIRRMKETFSRGNILAPFAENNFEVEYVSRKDVEDQLGAAMAPTFSNEYYLVSGDVGTGKTRTVMELVRRMTRESGSRGEGAPVYVMVTQGKCFSETLASAVNFKFDEHLSFKFFLDFLLRINSLPERDDHHRLTRVLAAIENSAFYYMQETGRPAVIVIDGINSLSKHIKGGLEKLQEKAKLWADTNIAKVILVSNNESTEMELQEHAGNWSRAASPIYVGDLEKSEAIKFLTKPKFMEFHADKNESSAFSLHEAEEIYELVGGRMLHLISFKRDTGRGISHVKTAEELKNKEREKFMTVSKTSTIYKTIKIINASEDGVPMARLVESTSEDHVKSLLMSSIVRLEKRGSGIMVKFDSKLTENVAKKLCQ